MPRCRRARRSWVGVVDTGPRIPMPVRMALCRHYAYTYLTDVRQVVAPCRRAFSLGRAVVVGTCFFVLRGANGAAICEAGVGVFQLTTAALALISGRVETGMG